MWIRLIFVIFQKKEKQKEKKKADRAREGANFTKVKNLLGMTDAKQLDVLEAGEYDPFPNTSLPTFSSSDGKATLTLPLGRVVVRFLGGTVPERKGQPTTARAGKARSACAERVATGRADIARVFDVIGKCMGHITKTPPKRETLLEEGMETLVFLSGPV